MPSRTRYFLGTCFFVSGGTGLAYEVLWSRHLSLFFGSTTEAVSVVLAVFMLGLGAGGHIIGRRVDRSTSPARLYGLLELGVGLWALVTPLLLQVVTGTWAAAASRLEPGLVAGTLLKALLSAVVLLPPAIAMGGTFPALVRAVSATRERAPGAVSVLYALNVLGAVLGSLLAGFVLPEVFGERGSMLLTGLVNVLLGTLVIGAARGLEPQASASTSAREGLLSSLRLLGASSGGRFVLAGLVVSGLTTMIVEIVFVRILGLVFGVSSYSFTLVLAVFLAGLGLGALATGLLARRRAPKPADFALVEVGVAALTALALAGTPLVPRIVAWVRQWPELSFGEVLLAKAIIATAFLLPLAVVAGLGVPVLIGALADDVARLGRLVGDAYLVNTVGTVAGSLLTGFVLVPLLGTEESLRIAFVLSAGTAAWGLLSLGGSRGRRFGGVATMAAALPVLLLSRWPASLYLVSDTDAAPPPKTSRFQLEGYLAASPRELLFLREGRNGTVSVAQTARSRVLFVGAHPDASDGYDMATQQFVSVVALSAHRAPADVLVVGYGSGVSVEAALRVPGVRRVDGIEIEKAVLDASPFFHHVNAKAERDPRARYVLDDARGYLAGTRRSWDVIVSEPSNPWRAGVANLFTADFYRSAKGRLRPGGLFAQWLQLYSIDEYCVKMVLRTLSSSFSEVQVWWLDAGDVVVLASDAPIRVSRARADSLLEGPFREDRLRYARIGTVPEFYARFLLDTPAVRSFVGRGPIHTDDRPLLEFEAPRAVFRSSGQEAARLVAAKIASGSLVPPLNGPAPPEEALWAGLSEMLRSAGRGPDAEAAARRAAALGDGALGRIRLAGLRLEARDVAAARRLLSEAEEVAAASGDGLSPDLVRDAKTMTALLQMAEGRTEEAERSFEEAGILEGPHGVQLVDFLRSRGRDADAVRLAERLLRVARLGGPVGSPEVSGLYLSLVKLNDERPAARFAELVRTLPPRDAGFPELPRLVTLARICERLGRPAEALAAARAAREKGAFDVAVHLVEWRALVALGDRDEADRLAARLERLSPAVFRRSPEVKIGAAPPPSPGGP
jgi:spermidine synthase